MNYFKVGLIYEGKIMNTYIEQMKFISSLFKRNGNIFEFGDNGIKR
jgi:hypothetical protein